MSNQKPNIFSFATSELSQDAILAWLLRWADPAFKTTQPALHQTGQYFIRKIFEKAANSPNTWKTLPEITDVQIDPQKYKIDLLIKLKCEDDIERYILLEDKVHAGVHDDQLNKYLKKITDIHAPRENVLPVFLKTGYQHEWSAAEEAGYVAFTAENLHEVWDFGKKQGISNDIFQEFGEYLDLLKQEFVKAHEAFQSFENMPVNDWQHWHWVGFFEKMKKDWEGTNYVNNQFRRNQMLSFWCGYAPVFEIMVDGEKIYCGPNIDLAISGDVPSLSIRMWVQHLTVKGIGFREYREMIIPKLQALNLGTPGKFKDAKNSILLMKIPINMENMKADDLEKHLKDLAEQLKTIEKSTTY